MDCCDLEGIMAFSEAMKEEREILIGQILPAFSSGHQLTRLVWTHRIKKTAET